MVSPVLRGATLISISSERFCLFPCDTAAFVRVLCISSLLISIFVELPGLNER